MKKLKKILCICILMFTIGLIFSGCSSSGENDQEDADESYKKMEENMEKYHKIQSTIHSDSEIGPGTITFTEDNYLSRMEEILCSIDKYVGREIRYTGTISVIHGGSDDVSVLGRYYRQVHDGHEHEGIVGIALIYDGNMVEEGKGAEAFGELAVMELNGVMVPVIKVSELNAID